MHSLPKSLLAAAFALAATGIHAQAPKYPDTLRKPVLDEYFGSIKVTDDYRWLEDRKDPAVIEWTAAQNKVTRAALDAAAPTQGVGHAHARTARLRARELLEPRGSRRLLRA